MNGEQRRLVQFGVVLPGLICCCLSLLLLYDIRLFLRLCFSLPFLCFAILEYVPFCALILSTQVLLTLHFCFVGTDDVL
jgi:hypothetical protein